MEISSIPPGFESLVPFTLKRVEDNKISSYCASADTSGTQTVQIETEFESSDDLKFMKSLRRRPWINYSQFDNNSGNESDSEQVDQVLCNFFFLSFFCSCTFVIDFYSYICFTLAEHSFNEQPPKRGYPWM